jgi:hypothetical protein
MAMESSQGDTASEQRMAMESSHGDRASEQRMVGNPLAAIQLAFSGW